MFTSPKITATGIATKWEMNERISHDFYYYEIIGCCHVCDLVERGNSFD